MNPKNDLLPEELNGYRKGSMGTNDLLFIDRKVLRYAKIHIKTEEPCNGLD